MSNVPKNIGMEMLVRSMGVNVVATDEIGGKSDISAIKYATLSGVNLLFTMHGKDVLDLYKKSEMEELVKSKVFDIAILLSNRNGVGTIEKIYDLQNENNLNIK